MIDYETFMNIDIDTKDFQEVYNSMADNKLEFTGGKMKIGKFINKMFKGKKFKLPKKFKNLFEKNKKGGDGSTVQNYDADNFFHLTSADKSYTNINNMTDYKYGKFDFIGSMNVMRT
jgi:hypothetical protein